MSARRLVTVMAAAGLAIPAVWSVVAAAVAPDPFDHLEHDGLFPACVTCHQGVVTDGAALYPEPAQCATCHDGRSEETVDWVAPSAPPATNLLFDHAAHAAVTADSIGCVTCHTDDGAARMAVQVAAVDRCIDCHAPGTEHLAAADTTCAGCHVPLAEASRIGATAITLFTGPPSHERDGFDGEHGLRIDASCATCHASEFCAACHIDAIGQPDIQRLGSNPLARVLASGRETPASHAAAEFLERHAAGVDPAVTGCRTCHTQESCLMCHRGTPEVARGLMAGLGAVGAAVSRHQPTDHGEAFRDGDHGLAASVNTTRCAACHVRSDCLDCHRPSPAAGGAGAYHPADYLARHPAAAYSRETACSDCHNPAGFCASCHVAVGLTAAGPLAGGYHDAKRFFIAGHGQAARQSLETCVACHTERDCLTCHSAVRGRRFNPHGPGFDAERLLSRNSQACTVCHGSVIPRS